MHAKIVVHVLVITILSHSMPCENSASYSVSSGRCVIPQYTQHQLTASSSRMCAFICSQLQPSNCISWSYRTNMCNVSMSVQSALPFLTNYTNLTTTDQCEWWSAVHELGHVAFWPMSNVTRTRNVVSDSGYLDLHENQVMQYVGDAVNFTGSFGVNERFNIDALASHCLYSFTMSVWVKVTNPARGPMPLLEGQIMPSSFYTRLWLFSDSSNVKFVIVNPQSSGFTDTPPIPPNVWTHITAVYDYTTPNVVIYHNATRILGASITAARLTSCAYFGSLVQIGAIARNANHNRVFQGYMKCFGVSDRALNDSEVAQLSQICQDHNNSP